MTLKRTSEGVFSGIEVGLVEWLPVDGDAAMGSTAGNVIARQSNDPPDVIPGSGHGLLLNDHVTPVDLRGARDNDDVSGSDGVRHARGRLGEGSAGREDGSHTAGQCQYGDAE